MFGVSSNHRIWALLFRFLLLIGSAPPIDLLADKPSCHLAGMTAICYLQSIKFTRGMIMIGTW